VEGADYSISFGPTSWVFFREAPLQVFSVSALDISFRLILFHYDFYSFESSLDFVINPTFFHFGFRNTTKAENKQQEPGKWTSPCSFPLKLPSKEF
jgi:hypothetical protein